MNKKIKKMLFIESGILILILIVFLIIQLGFVYLIPECIIHKNFGILCRGCQGTRWVINFSKGNFIDSFNFHPVFFVTIIYMLFVNLIFIINSFRNKEILTFLYPKLKFWIAFLIIIIVFTICRNIT